MFWGYRVHIGSPEGVPGTPPGNYMGLMGQEGDKLAPKGLVRPHIGRIGGEGKKGKREGRGGFGIPFLPSTLLLPSPSG